MGTGRHLEEEVGECGFYPATLGVGRLTVRSSLVKLVIREFTPLFGPINMIKNTRKTSGGKPEIPLPLAPTLDISTSAATGLLGQKEE